MSTTREIDYDDDGCKVIRFTRDRTGFEAGESEPWGDTFTLRQIDGLWYPDYDYGNAGSDGEPAKTALQAYFNVRQAFNAARAWASQMLQHKASGRLTNEAAEITDDDGETCYQFRLTVASLN